jgi:hypothetical protein
MVRIIVMEVSCPVEAGSLSLQCRPWTAKIREMYHGLSIFSVSNVAVRVEPVRATERAAVSPWLFKLYERLETSVPKYMMTIIYINV